MDASESGPPADTGAAPPLGQRHVRGRVELPQTGSHQRRSEIEAPNHRPVVAPDAAAHERGGSPDPRRVPVTVAMKNMLLLGTAHDRMTGWVRESSWRQTAHRSLPIPSLPWHARH